MAQTKQTPIPQSFLLTRTARAIYVASKVRCTGFLAYEDLDRPDRELYEGMAAEALRVALSEPVSL